MPWGLIRNQRTGLHHFLTFSCWHRRPFFRCLEAREDFERSLEKMRLRYRFQVAGYVVMPEHVHLLVTEPCIAGLATAVQAIKLSVVKLRTERPFWMPRYYDFVVPSTAKYVEKLRYIHLNPIRRGFRGLRTGYGQALVTMRPVLRGLWRSNRGGPTTGAGRWTRNPRLKIETWGNRLAGGIRRRTRNPRLKIETWGNRAESYGWAEISRGRESASAAVLCS